MLAVLALFVGACTRIPPAPLPETRNMAYDLLTENGKLGASMILLTLVDDSIYLKLDSAEVTGLDAAIKTWADVAKGAGITTVRHKIVTSRLEGRMLTDSGEVQFTIVDRVTNVPRDTSLSFFAIWNAKKPGWRLGLEQMTPHGKRPTTPSK